MVNFPIWRLSGISLALAMDFWLPSHLVGLHLMDVRPLLLALSWRQSCQDWTLLQELVESASGNLTPASRRGKS